MGYELKQTDPFEHKAKLENLEESEPEFSELVDYANTSAPESWETYRKKVDVTHLNKHEANMLLSLLDEYQDLCTIGPYELGAFDDPKYYLHIRLNKDAKPIREKLRRYDRKTQEEIDRQISELLKNGFIEPSHSPWAHNLHCVPKPDGTVRLCTDFRSVNKFTIRDSYPLPHASDIIESVRGAIYLTKLDIKKAYWNVIIDEESRPRAAFQTKNGLYQWVRMPFGLTNAPAQMQRIIEDLLKQIPNTAVFLDDIKIHSQTIPESLKSMRLVFDRLRRYKIPMSFWKCDFLKESVTYLGIRVSGKGISPKPEDVEKCLGLKRPKKKKELQSVCGVFNWLLPFIPHLAETLVPLRI